MEWTRLLEPEIQDFINKNASADVRELGLKKPPRADWPYASALAQIAARQKAERKIPAWLKHAGIILPAPDILEQASSTATAAYKARLCDGLSFVDLTGGCGVDSAAMLEKFPNGICIDESKTAAQLLGHNLKILTGRPIETQCAKAEDFVQTMQLVDVVCIDPQRRTQDKKGLYRLADCKPDITALLPALKPKANRVLLKTSPMLDITQTLEALEHATEAHVLEWNGDCKEVVYVVDFTYTGPCIITAVMLNDDGSVRAKLSFTREEERQAQAEYAMPGLYLYEPGPAFQKAGGFNMMAKTYGLKKLHPHTHLYTGDAPCPEFPGRGFAVQGVLAVDRKRLPFEQANLTLRNFPGETADLRKKLGLKEGGAEYLFACTLADETRALVHSRKFT
jgi:hypothetical protein